MEDHERQQPKRSTAQHSWGSLKSGDSLSPEDLDPESIENTSVNQLSSDNESHSRPFTQRVKKKIKPVVGKAKRIYPKPTSRSSETWVVNWIALPVAYLFPRSEREEWLGDLRETHHELIIDNHYPRWVVSAITVVKTLLLIGTALEVRVLMLVSHIRGIS